MKVKYSLNGLEETLNNLDLSQRRVNQEANNGLIEGAEIFTTVLRANTPLGDAQHGKHARDDVHRSGVITAGGTGYKRIRMGYGTSTGWYMYFVNDGTYSKGNPKGIVPRKQVEKTMDATSDVIQRALQQAIETALSYMG